MCVFAGYCYVVVFHAAFPFSLIMLWVHSAHEVVHKPHLHLFLLTTTTCFLITIQSIISFTPSCLVVGVVPNHVSFPNDEFEFAHTCGSMSLVGSAMKTTSTTAPGDRQMIFCWDIKPHVNTPLKLQRRELVGIHSGWHPGAATDGAHHCRSDQ